MPKDLSGAYKIVLLQRLGRIHSHLEKQLSTIEALQSTVIFGREKLEAYVQEELKMYKAIEEHTLKDMAAITNGEDILGNTVPKY